MDIIITSTNELKVGTLNNLLSKFEVNAKCTSYNIPNSNTLQQQPLNNTLECVRKRITICQENIDTIGKVIVSIENGIELHNNVYHDVCIFLCRYPDGTEKFYKSFGIKLRQDLFTKYIETNDPFYITFGEYLSGMFGVDKANWMKDSRFGNVDRVDQIKNVIIQWIIDIQTESYNDYPKKGVIFKDICSILENQSMLQLIIEHISNELDAMFDMSSIDYIIGLQSRGYLLGPIIAHQFKKGFIALRKQKNIPPVDNIIKENYSTEYSSDAMGIIQKDKYKGKKCIIFDDLCATGGSFIAAAQIVEKAGMQVSGFLSLYDVETLRQVCKIKNNYLVITRTNDEKMLYTIEPSNEILKSENIIVSKKMVCDWAIDLYNNDCIIISCSSNLDLANKISKQMGIPVANATIGKFNNGETRVEINENIRNKHVIIVCSTATNTINDDMVEMIFTIDACNRSGVSKITAILPYYPYSRSDKKDKPRVPIGAAVVANILNMLHVDNVISVDLHAGQEQGLIDKGFHNLYVVNYMAQYIYDNFLHENKDQYILVTPDAGSIKRTEEYAKRFGMPYIILHKQRDYSKPGTVLSSLIIGNKELYQGKTAIIVDDIGDTFNTMISAINELVVNGIKDVIVAVTHGVFSNNAIQRINNCDKITSVIVTNTLPQTKNMRQCKKIMVLDVSELLARTVDGIITGKSISLLFEKQ